MVFKKIILFGLIGICSSQVNVSVSLDDPSGSSIYGGSASSTQEIGIDESQDFFTITMPVEITVKQMNCDHGSASYNGFVYNGVDINNGHIRGLIDTNNKVTDGVCLVTYQHGPIEAIVADTKEGRLHGRACFWHRNGGFVYAEFMNGAPLHTISVGNIDANKIGTYDVMGAVVKKKPTLLGPIEAIPNLQNGDTFRLLFRHCSTAGHTFATSFPIKCVLQLHDDSLVRLMANPKGTEPKSCGKLRHPSICCPFCERKSLYVGIRGQETVIALGSVDAETLTLQGMVHQASLGKDKIITRLTTPSHANFNATPSEDLPGELMRCLDAGETWSKTTYTHGVNGKNIDDCWAEIAISPLVKTHVYVESNYVTGVQYISKAVKRKKDITTSIENLLKDISQSDSYLLELLGETFGVSPKDLLQEFLDDPAGTTKNYMSKLIPDDFHKIAVPVAVHFLGVVEALNKEV
jgi:hypothetical protein